MHQDTYGSSRVTGQELRRGLEAKFLADLLEEFSFNLPLSPERFFSAVLDGHANCLRSNITLHQIE